MPTGTVCFAPAAYKHERLSLQFDTGVFDMQAFIDTLGSLRAQSTTAGDAKLRASAFGAAVSALGLTNRMVLEEGATEARNAGTTLSALPTCCLAVCADLARVKVCFPSTTYFRHKHLERRIEVE